MMKIFYKMKYVLFTTIIFFSLSFFYTASSNELDFSLDYIDNNIRNNNALENNYFFPNSIENVEEIILISSTEKETSEVINIKQKFEEITKKQNFSIEKINDAMNALKDRSKLKTFLVGNNLGILKFQMVQITDQVYALEELIRVTTNITDKTQMDKQIEFLKDKKLEVEKFIFEQENEFSLFGWFVVLL